MIIRRIILLRYYALNLKKKVYKGWDAFWKVIDFATKAGIGIVTAKAVIAAVSTAGAATAGAGAIDAGLVLAPAFLKSVTDIGVYGSLTVSAAILWYCDGGFIVSESTTTKPLGAVVYVFGYPVLERLQQ